MNSYVEQLTAEKASAYEPLFERLGLTLESADNFSSEEEAQRIEQWKHKIVLLCRKTKRRTANSWIRKAYFYIYIFSDANLNVSISGVEKQYAKYAHSDSIRS